MYFTKLHIYSNGFPPLHKLCGTQTCWKYNSFSHVPLVRAARVWVCFFSSLPFNKSNKKSQVKCALWLSSYKIMKLLSRFRILFIGEYGKWVQWCSTVKNAPRHSHTRIRMRLRNVVSVNVSLWSSRRLSYICRLFTVTSNRFSC